MSISEPDFLAMRYGYGLTLGAPAAQTRDELLAELAKAEPVPQSLAGLVSAPRIVEARAESQALVDARRRGEAPESIGRGSDMAMMRRKKSLDTLQSDQSARLMAAVEAPVPFFERLVAFWSNHFTVSCKQARVREVAGPYEVEAIRPHVLGRFEDMLLAAESHPGMLTYLDQERSIGPHSPQGLRASKGLNENMAREILELHTLGAMGGYGQEDVVALARLLTGWTVDARTGVFAFRHGIAEPGPKRLLGKSFGGARPRAEDAAEALKMLAAHPSTAGFVAGKLARHFISEQPPESAVAALSETFRKSGGDLRAVYARLLALSEPIDFGELVKRPYDFVVSVLRLTGTNAVGLHRPRSSALATRALRRMQQPTWTAPAPDGWSEKGQHWMTAVGLTARFDFIRGMLPHFVHLTPGQLMDMALGSARQDRTTKVVSGASSREEALSLVLASPEFQRR